MDAAQWSQQVPSLARPMDQEITSTTPPNNVPTNSRGGGGGGATPQQQQSLERRTRPQKDQNINCPRCNSTNTKFCYYNNYSLTQPRYFCKTCRRYWTQGGSLRNVPVGGGSRKNKRSSSSAPFSTSSTPPPTSTTTPPPMHNKLLIPDLNPPTSLSHLLTASQNPNIKYLEGQDLNLAFPIQGLFHHHMDHHHPHQLAKMEGNNTNNNENHEPPININGNISNNNSCTTTNTTTTTTTTSPPPLSALELLRTGIASRGSLNPFVPMPMTDSNTLYQSGYPSLQDFKPSMNIFSSPNHDQDHNNNMVGSGDHHHHHNNNTPSSGNARLLFPFADMNKLAAANTNSQHHDQIDDQRKDNAGGNDHHSHHHHHHQQQQQAPAGYWSGMLGGGAW